MKKDLIALATGIIFLVVGIYCFFYAEKIQQRNLDFYAKHKTAEKFIPFFNFMKAPSYILSLRIIGLIGIAVFVFIIIVFIKDL